MSICDKCYSKYKDTGIIPTPIRDRYLSDLLCSYCGDICINSERQTTLSEFEGKNGRLKNKKPC